MEEKMIPTDKGETCDKCGQYIKLYKRKLNSGMAITLIRIYKSNVIKNDDWLQVKDYLRVKGYTNSHDWTLLKYWGLIISKKEKREDGSKSNGYYKITLKGINFVNGKVNVPKHIFIYNNEVYRFSEEETNIKNSLGEKFDYNELMGIAK